jgi:hypothetical protein
LASLGNAVDLIALQYTLILAEADSVVTFVQDDSIVLGPNPFYWLLLQSCTQTGNARDMTTSNMAAQR